MAGHKFLQTITEPLSVITPVPSGNTYPEALDVALERYEQAVDQFAALVRESTSSAKVLEAIRTPRRYDADIRMSLLKIFRRCVSLVCDTEQTKKINAIPTATIIENFGHTFKPIDVLKAQFGRMESAVKTGLIALLAENDDRGKSGYALTGMFFDWFETTFRGLLSIDGPRGAGPDIELSVLFPKFSGSFPCDFVIRNEEDSRILAVGFARYDATRGGSQSDDRTGGNANKVDKAKAFCAETGEKFKLVFLADGPGLAHRDTWHEACELDGQWGGNVRVTTLKLAPQRVESKWLLA